MGIGDYQTRLFAQYFGILSNVEDVLSRVLTEATEIDAHVARAIKGAEDTVAVRQVRVNRRPPTPPSPPPPS